MAPVSTVPAVPTSRKGVRPAARSAATASRSAPRSMRHPESTGSTRSASLPRPDISMALRTQEWVEAEA